VPHTACSVTGNGSECCGCDTWSAGLRRRLVLPGISDRSGGSDRRKLRNGEFRHLKVM
jgi:hypothetical protein